MKALDINYLIASSSMPEVYAYEEIDGRKFWDGGILSNTPIKELIDAHQRFWEKRIGSKNLENSVRRKSRHNEREEEANNYSSTSQEQQQIQRIPNLEIYVVNLLDPKENNNNTVRNADSYDFEWIKDRNIDIKLGNGFDAKTYGLYTDYVNLIEKLISLGDKDELLKEKINRILEEYTPRRVKTEEIKRNIDILKSTF